MLFKQLYNWIKYKTLPSSFLFKNRLFIERDSKHKRIFSNFGNHYRNSKWNTFSSYNIKHKFYYKFGKLLKYSFYFFILIFILINHSNYYINLYIFNTLAFFWWICFDAFNYFFSFLFWFIIIFISFITNFLYTYIFSHFFTIEKMPEYSKEQIQAFSKPMVEPILIRKEDYQLILYSWATNLKSFQTPRIIENLFDSSVNSFWWNSFSDFYIKLYKSAYLLNLTNSIIFYRELNYSKQIEKIFINQLKSKYFAHSVYFLLNKNESYFDKKRKESTSLKYLNTLYDNNPMVFSKEFKQSQLANSNKTGLFYLDDSNYEKLINANTNFNELKYWETVLTLELSSTKWNRWLYKYSITHRKTNKNSHKLTMLKKLINSGNLDSKFFDKNLWNSEYFSRHKGKNMSALYDLFFDASFKMNLNNFLQLNNFNVFNNENKKKNLELLSWQENSFFWYLKRFYMLNSFTSNVISSKFNFKIDKKNSHISDILTNQNNINSAALQSFNLSFKSLNYVLYNDLNEFFFFLDKNSTKDAFYQCNDNDLFINDNLNVLHLITSSPEIFNFLNFYNNLNVENNNTLNSNTFIKKNLEYSQNSLISFYLNNNYLEKSFLTDLNLFIVNNFK